MAAGSLKLILALMWFEIKVAAGSRQNDGPTVSNKVKF